MKLRELNEDYEKVKRENIELKRRLEIKEKNENKLEGKLKTLEKVMSSMRTQPNTVPKENQRVLSENDINRVMATEIVENEKTICLSYVFFVYFFVIHKFRLVAC
jgi:hypothetical protein